MPERRTAWVFYVVNSRSGTIHAYWDGTPLDETNLAFGPTGCVWLVPGTVSPDE